MTDANTPECIAPMPSDDFIVLKKSGSQAGIEPTSLVPRLYPRTQTNYEGKAWERGYEPTTFGELAHCSNH